MRSAIFYILIIASGIFGDRLEEISVDVDLLGMDLEDYYDRIAISQRNVLLRKPNAYKLKLELEKGYGSFIRNESQFLRDQHNINDLKLSVPILRQWEILDKLGDIAMPDVKWNELVSFVNELEKISDETPIPCYKKENCTFFKKDVRHILATSRDAQELQQVWSSAQDIYAAKKHQYFNILQLVEDAAEINDISSAELYWDMLVEHPNAFSTANELWEVIEPLYRKFHAFIHKRLAHHYVELENSTSIPVYLLGSEFGTDWSNIAPLVLPHRYLYDEIVSMLDFEKVGGKKVYEIAEKFTANLNLGRAGQQFWNSSLFNQSCPSHLLSYSSQKYTQVITCNTTGWVEYLDAHEDMVHTTLNNQSYAWIPFSAFRISALDEALGSLSTILAVKNLPLVGIVSEDVFFKDSEKHQSELTALLLTALRILPRLPYYLAADTWRLETLQNKEMKPENLTSTWWHYRETIQRVTGGTNESIDFLSDPYIRANKPYIGKFFGTILQFQILEYFQNENKNGENILQQIARDENFRTLLKQRSLYDWTKVVYDNLYYDISADSLLEYFKPLEAYMDSAPDEQVTHTVRPKTTATITEVTAAPTAPSVELPRDEAPKTVPDLVTIENTLKEVPPKLGPVPPKINTRQETEQTSTGTIVGAIIGLAALVVILAILGKRQCARRSVTANRRHDV